MNITNKEITLMAPMNGMVIPLERCPDPVFSQKMVGDGVSIDPIDGMLYSPCDGEIVFIHKSAHAVTIKTANEVEVLIHIGLETVKLNGEGFTLKVASGDKVKAGTPLIEFDMQLVASKAPHLLTQMVVSTMDLVENITVENADQVRVGEAICKVALKQTDNETIESEDTQQKVSEPIGLVNPTGLHARPAAVLVQLANQFSSKVEMRLGDKVGNAKSVTSLLKLDTKHGDFVEMVATGPDAAEALATIVPQVETGLGDEGCIPVTAKPEDKVEEVKESQPEVAQAEPQELGDISMLKGTSASAGLAIGQIFQLKEEDLVIDEFAGSVEEERTRLSQALRQGKLAVEALFNSFQKNDPEKAAIFIAHFQLLEDPELMDLVEEKIVAGKSAQFAWKESYEAQANELLGLSSEVLAGRANDLLDVGKRVLHIILGVETGGTSFPKGSILVAEDLTPSVTANLDAEIVSGFCTTLGGSTSHVAILARSLGIPAIVGIDPRVFSLEDGHQVILDGTKGTLKTDADSEYIELVKVRQEQTRIRKEKELAVCQEHATTIDGIDIEVVGNVGKPSEAEVINGLGGEGVGLLRSEFIFQDRATAPTEDEQYEAYKATLQAVKPTDRVVIRTLDVGGDKPLAYLPLPEEENPFLGERGIRVGLNRPEILRTQVRALLRASIYGNLHIMFPMIGDIQELRQAKAIVEEERLALGVEPVQVGIMIEVPSAALLAEQFAPEVDFFSIGTNDLSQYTMAIDRGHPKLAAKADGLHPSILRLIKITCDAAKKHGKWAGVCGGLAGDPQAVPVLIGLGVEELSISIPSIPEVKARIRTLTMSDCQALAEQAMNVATFEEVRELSPNPYI